MFEVFSPHETGLWQEALKKIEGLDLHYRLEYCRLFTGTGIPELFFTGREIGM